MTFEDIWRQCEQASGAWQYNHLLDAIEVRAIDGRDCGLSMYISTQMLTAMRFSDSGVSLMTFTFGHTDTTYTPYVLVKALTGYYLTLAYKCYR